MTPSTTTTTTTSNTSTTTSNTTTTTLPIHRLIFIDDKPGLEAHLSAYAVVESSSSFYHPRQFPLLGTIVTPTTTTTPTTPTNRDNNDNDNDEEESKEPCPYINTHDHHGQTPLTLALQLGRKQLIPILLRYNASTLVKTRHGWRPLDEAISYGDRDTIYWIMRRQEEELKNWIKVRGRQVGKLLVREIPDFAIEMNWKFHTQIPLVSHLLPSDTYKIYKKGRSIRIDFTLIGFHRLHYERANVSLIYDFKDKLAGAKLALVNHDKKIVQQLAQRKGKADSTTNSDVKKRKMSLEEAAMEVKDWEETVNAAMSLEITSSPFIHTKSASFIRQKEKRKQPRFSSFLPSFLTSSTSSTSSSTSPSSEYINKTEMIGEYETAVWELGGVEVDIRTRWEHVDEETLKKRGLESILKSEKTTDKGKDDDDTSSTCSSSNDVFVDACEDLDDMKLETPNETGMTISESRETLPSSYSSTYSSDSDESTLPISSAFKKYRPNLPAPPPPTISYDEYFKLNDLNDTRYIHLGRKMRILLKKSKKFKCRLWTYPLPSSEQPTSSQSSSVKPFPIHLAQLIPLLDLLAYGSHNQHIDNLKEFFQHQFPSALGFGESTDNSTQPFPVKVEIPILPILTATVTFGNASETGGAEKGDGYFDIPGEKEGYTKGFVLRKDGVLGSAVAEKSKNG